MKACRFYDDYYIYVSSKDEADKVLKGLSGFIISICPNILTASATIRTDDASLKTKFQSSAKDFSAIATIVSIDKYIANFMQVLFVAK